MTNMEMQRSTPSHKLIVTSRPIQLNAIVQEMSAVMRDQAALLRVNGTPVVVAEHLESAAERAEDEAKKAMRSEPQLRLKRLQ